MRTIKDQILEFQRMKMFYKFIFKGQHIPYKNRLIVLMAVFHTFPPGLADLNTYFTEVTVYLNTTAHLMVSVARLATLNGLVTTGLINWATIYPLSIGANSTHNARVHRHNLIGLIEACLLDIFDNIPEGLYTVEDRSALRRPEKATTHTHATVYPNAPTIETVHIQHLGQTLKLTDPSHPDSQHLPAKQMLHLETYIGVAGILDADIKWGIGEAVSHFLYTEHFTDAQVGMTLYQRACYESTRHEKSDYSPVIRNVIS
jgi:hypothetical protein